MRLLVMAHGELVMLGGYVAYWGEFALASYHDYGDVAVLHGGELLRRRRRRHPAADRQQRIRSKTTAMRTLYAGLLARSNDIFLV